MKSQLACFVTARPIRALIWILWVGTLTTACSKPPSAPSPAQVSQPEDQTTRYRRELSALASDAPPLDIAMACHFLANASTAETLSKEERERCRHASLAASEIGKSNSSSSVFARTPEQWTQSAISFGATNSEVRAAEKHRKVNERKAAAEEAKEEASRKRELLIAGAEDRRALASRLREGFLDQGLDIKVRVSGKHAERITMTYVLFSDVWSHRFQQEGVLDSLHTAGFERVDMTDDYDWHVYWTF